MNTAPTISINPATHDWRSSGFKLEKCQLCGKQTTGRLWFRVGKRKEKALCSDCAALKGFGR